MKSSYNRRYTRRNRSLTLPEAAFFKKESKENSFFNGPAEKPFFTANYPVIHRKCEHCEQEEKKEADKKLHRKQETSAAATPSKSALSNPGNGQALPTALSGFFGHAMGFDFSKVRIFTGAAAHKAAKSVQAKAYTLGAQVVFAEGQYQPETFEGKKLLAHELTHVMQQGSGVARKAGSPASMEDAEETETATLSTSGMGSPVPGISVYGNCAGAQVEGRTDASYDQSTYAVTGATVKRAKHCADCEAEDCVKISGVIHADFVATTNVTLPPVPPGNWSECERTAIQTFIDTTLDQHEQQHVAAFHTFDGKKNIPFNYTGCKDGWETFVDNKYKAANEARAKKANDKSKLLDANGANIFNITCACPDPVPKAAEDVAGDAS